MLPSNGSGLGPGTSLYGRARSDCAVAEASTAECGHAAVDEAATLLLWSGDVDDLRAS